jgi:hypothetical protein
MAFAAPCPTRFGSNIFSVKDVLRSNPALRAAVMEDDWSHATSNVRYANNIRMSLAEASNTTYFADAQTLVDITQPILDAIHAI